MPYFEDLSCCNEEFPGLSLPLIAIGWLDPNHPVSTGVVSKEFFNKLVHLLEHLWSPSLSLGIHLCAFCGTETALGLLAPKEEPKLQFDYALPVVQNGDLFIPALEGRSVYASPSLVAHYINAHMYLPPKCFQDAVMDCPDMRSSEYLAIMEKRGLKRWDGGTEGPLSWTIGTGN